MTIKINKIVVNSDLIDNVSKDKARINKVCDALRKVFQPLGYQIIASGVGASYHYTDETKRKNAYVINIVGGLCAGTIKEYSSSYVQNAMKKNQSIGAQPFYSGAISKDSKWRITPFEKITWLPRAWDDHFSPASFKGIDYPVKWMEKANFDWCQEETTDKLVTSIVKMTATRFYKEGIKTDKSLVSTDVINTTPNPDSPTTPTTPDTSTTDTTDSTTNTKKLQTKIIEKTYTHPYYNTNTGIITTDNNGAFNKKIILPYNGKYKINYHYSGSQNYAPTNKTIYLEYHAGQYFITKLLKTKITETDTDNKTTITETGTIPKEEHTKTEITTITYKNGVETGRTTTTRIDDEYNNTFKNPDNNPTTPTTPNTPTTPTTPETPTVNDTGKETILTKTITPKNNKPDITTLGSDYKEADPNGTYTITSREILRTQTLDSLCQQLYGYVPKYTFFRAYGSNTKYIIERKKWNVIVRALNKYHVFIF